MDPCSMQISRYLIPGPFESGGRRNSTAGGKTKGDGIRVACLSRVPAWANVHPRCDRQVRRTQALRLRLIRVEPHPWPRDSFTMVGRRRQVPSEPGCKRAPRPEATGQASHPLSARPPGRKSPMVLPPADELCRFKAFVNCPAKFGRAFQECVKREVAKCMNNPKAYVLQGAM